MRALLGFAAEEAKHIHLFRRFREEFERGFGTPCEVIGPPEAVAEAVLSHQPLAVALAILQIEWMTQRHWTDSVQDDQDLDPQFKSLLKHHWMEESQHAKLDTLMVESLSSTMDGPTIDGAVDEYLEIGAMIDGALAQQVEFDIENLARATGRKLSTSEREAFVATQLQGQRWTYLGSGMMHPQLRRDARRDAAGGGGASGEDREGLLLGSARGGSLVQPRAADLGASRRTPPRASSGSASRLQLVHLTEMMRRCADSRTPRRSSRLPGARSSAVTTSGSAEIIH